MEHTTAQPVLVDAYLEGAALGTHLLRPNEMTPVQDIEFDLYLELVSVDFENEEIEVKVSDGDVEGGPFTIERGDLFDIRVEDIVVAVEIADSFDF